VRIDRYTIRRLIDGLEYAIRAEEHDLATHDLVFTGFDLRRRVAGSKRRIWVWRSLVRDLELVLERRKKGPVIDI
jgi:hypothetical protein